MNCIETKTVNYSTLSLEQQFETYATQEVNIRGEYDFPHRFLEPNEACPEGIKPHLEWLENGITVSTGTVRSLANIIFSNEECEGFLIIDLDPQVKAYVDFETMAFRLSDTLEEYVKLIERIPISDKLGYYIKLAQRPKYDPSLDKIFYETLKDEFSSYNKLLDERIDIISDKIIANNTIPEKIKDYYFHHIRDFASVYLRQPMRWRDESENGNSESFKECRYDKNNDHFLKIKHYADSGNIISKIGNINDLEFLEGRTISIVDTSNILDYTPIDLKGKGDFHPRVIWTIPGGNFTTYLSHMYEPLDDQEKAEFHKLLTKIPSHINDIELWKDYDSTSHNNDQLDSTDRKIYSKRTLDSLRQYESFLHTQTT